MSAGKLHLYLRKKYSPLNVMCMLVTEICSDISDTGRSAFFHCNVIAIAARTLFFFFLTAGRAKPRKHRFPVYTSVAEWITLYNCDCFGEGSTQCNSLTFTSADNLVSKCTLVSTKASFDKRFMIMASSLCCIFSVSNKLIKIYRCSFYVFFATVLTKW